MKKRVRELFPGKNLPPHPGDIIVTQVSDGVWVSKEEDLGISFHLGRIVISGYRDTLLYFGGAQ